MMPIPRPKGHATRMVTLGERISRPQPILFCRLPIPDSRLPTPLLS
ncbi:MAG: hypothetical protein F6K65_27000 [Moorea sp. SIO3C2]|nr:hypothetical protein [Moorena sp. SIO3C2]